MEVSLPIPTYDQLMLPALQHAAEKTWDMRELIAQIADDLNLTQAERDQEIPSGGTKLIASRVHWAKTYLKQAGLLEQPKRGKVQISAAGREALRSKPSRIDLQLLQQFPAFQGFMARTKAQEKAVGPVGPVPQAVVASTPEEQLEAASGSTERIIARRLVGESSRDFASVVREADHRPAARDGLWRLEVGCW